MDRIKKENSKKKIIGRLNKNKEIISAAANIAEKTKIKKIINPRLEEI